MTAPFIAEAERAAAEAMCAYFGVPVRPMDHEAAAAIVAAVVPILAEHFAQEVLAEADRGRPLIEDRMDEVHVFALEAAARVIREAATPTEGGTS